MKCLHGVYMNKLTKSYIDKLAVPVSGQAFYRDPLFTGFAVRITAQGAKSFILERRVNHKVKRITLSLIHI